MHVLQSVEIITSYDSVVEKCKESEEPIYLINNGKIELVVMDVKAFKRKEQELEAKVSVIKSYMDQIKGGKMYTTEEVVSMIEKKIK